MSRFIRPSRMPYVLTTSRHTVVSKRIATPVPPLYLHNTHFCLLVQTDLILGLRQRNDYEERWIGDIFGKTHHDDVHLHIWIQNCRIWIQCRDVICRNRNKSEILLSRLLKKLNVQVAFPQDMPFCVPHAFYIPLPSHPSVNTLKCGSGSVIIIHTHAYLVGGRGRRHATGTRAGISSRRTPRNKTTRKERRGAFVRFRIRLKDKRSETKDRRGWGIKVDRAN